MSLSMQPADIIMTTDPIPAIDPADPADPTDPTDPTADDAAKCVINHPRSKCSEPVMKKWLTSSLEEIDVHTAGAAALPFLTIQQMYSMATATKLADRIRKRDDAILVDSFEYSEPIFDVEAGEQRVAAEAAFIAHNLTFRDKMSLKDQAIHNALDAEKEVSDARYRVYRNQEWAKAEKKERDVAYWFKSHCFNIDAAVRVITAKIPGYMAEIVVPPPAKKSKPSAGEVQITLAHAFKEPDGLEPIAFVSKLSAQLTASDAEEARLTKSTTARALKLANRPVTKDERKNNKGVRKLEWSVHLKDQADKRLVCWFQQHSVAIKAKLADVTAGSVVV